MIPRVGCASRSLAVRAASSRQFHGNTIIYDKAGDKVREMGQKVNLKVGQGLASAIDKGEKATYATKEKLKEGQGYVEKQADGAAKGTQKVKEDLKQELKK